MPPSNFVVLADPSASSNHPAHQHTPVPSTSASTDAVAAVLNAFAAFVHTHVNPSALWGFRLLSSPSAAPLPTLLPLSSGFAGIVTEHLTQRTHFNSFTSSSVPQTLDTLSRHLASISGHLAATVHLLDSSGSSALARVAVSPARTGRQRLAATVSVRNVILVLAPFPSTIEQARHFLRDSLGPSEAAPSGRDLAHFVHLATSHLVQSGITASLLSCGTVVHWLHPCSISDRGLQQVESIRAFAAALGGVFASICDLDLSLPLPLLFSGLAPSNVHIPSVFAHIQQHAAPSSATRPLGPSLHISTPFDSESTRVPVAALRSGPFPRGPWWPIARLPAHSLLLQPLCHELATSNQLAVCLEDLPKSIQHLLANPLHALIMQASSPHLDGVDHYATIVRMSERFSLFGVLEAPPPLDLMGATKLDVLDSVEDMDIDSQPLPEPLSHLPPLLDPFLGLGDYPPPDSRFSTQDAEGDYEFDYDDIFAPVSTSRMASHIQQAGLLASEPATPRPLVPPTPRSTRVGMTPARAHSSALPIPELGAFLDDPPESAAIDCLFLTWYRTLLYMPSVCIFANFIDALPRIRTRLFDIAEVTGNPVSATLGLALLPPSSLSAKLRAVKMAANPQSSSQAEGDSQGSQSSSSHSQQMLTASLALSDRPLRSGLSLARAPSFSVVPSALAAAPKKRKSLGRAASASFDPPPPPAHVLPSEEVAVIRAHTDVANPRPWLQDYQLREIMVQILFHFELMLSVLDTSEGVAVNSDVTVSQCKSAIETYLSKLQLMCDQGHDQTKFPTRGSSATPRRASQHKQAATPRTKAGADTRLRKWIEQAIVFHYHDHVPAFVTQLYQQHGGDMEAYVNATSNPFSPKLAKAAAAPVIKKSQPSVLNTGSAAIKALLDKLHGREVLIPLAHHSHAGPAHQSKPSLSRSSSMPTANASQAISSSSSSWLWRPGPIAGGSTRFKSSSSSAASSSSNPSTGTTNTPRKRRLSTLAEADSTSASPTSSVSSPDRDPNSPTASRKRSGSKMAKLGPSPTDDDSPSAAARRRRQRIVNGLMFGTMLRGNLMSPTQSAAVAVGSAVDDFDDAQDDSQRRRNTAPPPLHALTRAASGDTQAPTLPRPGLTRSASAIATFSSQNQSDPVTSTFTSSSAVAVPAPQEEAQPKEATVSLVARGKPGFKSLLARMKSKKPDALPPESAGARPAPQQAPHTTSTPQKASFVSPHMSATPLARPSTPRDRIFAQAETPGSASVKRSARKLGVSVKTIFTPFKELKEVAAELEEGDEDDKMEM